MDQMCLLFSGGGLKAALLARSVAVSHYSVPRWAIASIPGDWTSLSVCMRCVMMKMCAASLSESFVKWTRLVIIFNIAKLKAGDGLEHQKSPWLLWTEILVLACFCKCKKDYKGTICRYQLWWIDHNAQTLTTAEPQSIISDLQKLLGT